MLVKSFCVGEDLLGQRGQRRHDESNEANQWLDQDEIRAD